MAWFILDLLPRYSKFWFQTNCLLLRKSLWLYSFKRFLRFSVLSSTQELLAFSTISPWEGAFQHNSYVKMWIPKSQRDLFICVKRIVLSFSDKSLKFLGGLKTWIFWPTWRLKDFRPRVDSLPWGFPENLNLRSKYLLFHTKDMELISIRGIKATTGDLTQGAAHMKSAVASLRTFRCGIGCLKWDSTFPRNRPLGDGNTNFQNCYWPPLVALTNCVGPSLTHTTNTYGDETTLLVRLMIYLLDPQWWP